MLCFYIKSTDQLTNNPYLCDMKYWTNVYFDLLVALDELFKVISLHKIIEQNKKLYLLVL